MKKVDRRLARLWRMQENRENRQLNQVRREQHWCTGPAMIPLAVMENPTVEHFKALCHAISIGRRIGELARQEIWARLPCSICGAKGGCKHICV